MKGMHWDYFEKIQSTGLHRIQDIQNNFTEKLPGENH